EEWKRNPETRGIIQKLEKDPGAIAHYTWDSRDLRYKGRIPLLVAPHTDVPASSASPSALLNHCYRPLLVEPSISVVAPTIADNTIPQSLTTFVNNTRTTTRESLAVQPQKPPSLLLSLPPSPFSPSTAASIAACTTLLAFTITISRCYLYPSATPSLSLSSSSSTARISPIVAFQPRFHQ
ncbi:hypothetical protein BHM03_00027856, partial [Ensete ventricosum]